MPFVYYLCFHIIAKTFILIEIFRQETKMSIATKPRGGGGALGYFLGGHVPPGTPNWHPVLKKISPKIDTPF